MRSYGKEKYTAAAAVYDGAGEPDNTRVHAGVAAAVRPRTEKTEDGADHARLRRILQSY
jgi:hypothetical protein